MSSGNCCTAAIAVRADKGIRLANQGWRHFAIMMRIGCDANTSRQRRYVQCAKALETYNFWILY